MTPGTTISEARRFPSVDREKRLVYIVSLGDFAIERDERAPASEALSGISRRA